MYVFAVEDCLYHPTCKKRFFRRFGKHRESNQKMFRPTNRVSRKLLIKRNIVPWVCLQFVFVIFPDHTHLLFLALKI